LHATPGLRLLSSGMSLHAIPCLTVLQVLFRFILLNKFASSALVKRRVSGLLLILTLYHATILLLLLPLVQECWLLLLKERSRLPTSAASGESISSVSAVISGDRSGMGEARLARVGGSTVQTSFRLCFIDGDIPIWW
jgi:hypothetical protein